MQASTENESRHHGAVLSHRHFYLQQALLPAQVLESSVAITLRTERRTRLAVPQR